MTHHPHRQQGAITLMVAIGLVMIAALTGFYSVQSVFIDRLTGQAQIQATQARLAAEAALAWAQAEVQHATQTTSATAFWNAPSTPCPANRTGLQWQCVHLQVPPGTGVDIASANVVAMRDVVNAPHVAELQASSVLKDQRSRAQVQQSLFMPTVLPVPASASTAAVVLSSSATSLCASTAWQQVLGDLSAEHIRAWSQAQERQGLHALSQPSRTIYWVDSPAPWTQSVGSAQAPVLLVFSATACSPFCPSMVSGVRIHGTVVLDTQCQDDRARAWRAGQIDGQLLINSAWPEAPNASQVTAQPYARKAYLLPWPQGMDARQVQIVNGSWREGTP
jgi:Tfp pilus assembly protein PilX